GFTMPQKLSPAAAEAQLAAVEVARIRKLASPQAPTVLPVVFLHVGSHEYTVITDVVPPLLTSLITNRSPALCTPVKGAAADIVAAQRDGVREEPEPLLRVAATVQAVRSEEQHLAFGRRVARREAVQQVVLVGQTASAVLPRPLVDVLRVLRPAAC